jgi:hypothetical protein
VVATVGGKTRKAELDTVVLHITSVFTIFVPLLSKAQHCDKYMCEQEEWPGSASDEQVI